MCSDKVLNYEELIDWEKEKVTRETASAVKLQIEQYGVQSFLDSLDQDSFWQIYKHFLQ